MKPKTMILLVVAVGCGLAASFMTSKLLSERREQPQQPVEEKVTLLVTKTKVPKNTVLKEPEKYFEVRERNKADEPKEKYFTSFAEIKDKRLKKELKPDVHVSPEDIQDRTGTMLDTPPGYGAIGLRANPALLAGNQVWPGDKVDILLTQRGTNNKVSSRTVLADVQVLAVGERTDRGGEGNPQGNTVTVALLPEDAAKVRVAETLGELSLWLHGSDEDVKHSKRVITEDDVLRAGHAAEAPKE